MELTSYQAAYVLGVVYKFLEAEDSFFEPWLISGDLHFFRLAQIKSSTNVLIKFNLESLEEFPEPPAGCILPWFDEVKYIPWGWVLCDGTRGTPDLRDFFVLGAGDSADPGDSGGSQRHAHGGSFASHWHALWSVRICLAGAKWYGCPDPGTGDKTGSISTDSKSHLPPFESLIFMQKLPYPDPCCK